MVTSMHSTPLRRRAFLASHLKVVATAEQFRDDREPPLRFGYVVRLNSGGPPSLIVDLLDSRTIAISWLDEQRDTHEMTLPSACVHRIRLVG
jgi:hypothetical protein